MAILAGISFYVIPIVLGAGIFSVVRLITKNRNDHHDLAHNVIELFKYFISGALYIYTAALLVSKFGGTFSSTLETVLRISLLASVVAIVVYLIKYFGRISLQKVPPGKILVLILLFTLSVSIYKVWRWDSPLNTTLDWDLYEHQTIINLMKDNVFDFSPLKMSDTFQFYSYSSFFHTLVFVPQLFFDTVDTLHFWWYAQFFHFLVTILASYTIGYSVTKNRWIGVISAIFGALVLESFAAYTSLFLLPQTLVATAITLFTANTILHFKDKEPIINFITVALSTFILLNHMILGLAGIGIILFNIAYLRIFKGKGLTKVHRTALAIFTVILVAAPFITKGVNLDFLNRGEAEYFTPSLLDKYKYMRDFYGYSLLAFFPIGIYYIYKKGSTDTTLLGLIALGTLSMVLGNLPYVLKFYTIGRFFVHAIMAMGVWELIKRTSKYVRLLGVLSLSFSLLIIFLTNISTFKQTPSYNGISTHVTESEIGAATFIESNYRDQNAIIISEPATMYILEGLSGVNSPGGVFTDLNTRKTVSNIYFSRDSELMKYEIFGARDTLLPTETPEKALLVISGRFSKWQNASRDQKFGIYWNVWKPADISLEEYDFIEFIEDYAKFELVHKNKGLRIYEIDNPYLN
jgi:hypothetical protein